MVQNLCLWILRRKQLWFLCVQGRKMASTPLLKDSLYNKLGVEAQMCSIRQKVMQSINFTVLMKSLWKTEKVNELPKVTQFNLELREEPKPPQSYALYPSPYTALPSTARCASVMLMTTQNKDKSRDESFRNQDSISEPKVSRLTDKNTNLFCIPYFSNISKLQ